jgi:hypothetical protein
MPSKKLFLLSSLAIALAFYASCYYDKADLLYPNSLASECDTTVVSYSEKVVPVLSQNCYSCHTAASAGGGVVLGTYEADKAYANNGKLLGVSIWSQGFSPMPKGGSRMTTCQIAKISRWIAAGAPNN